MKIKNISKNIQGIEGVDGIVYIKPNESRDVELSEYSKSKDFSDIFVIEKKNFFPKLDHLSSNIKTLEIENSKDEESNNKPEKKKRGRPAKKVSE